MIAHLYIPPSLLCTSCPKNLRLDVDHIRSATPEVFCVHVAVFHVVSHHSVSSRSITTRRGTEGSPPCSSPPSFATPARAAPAASREFRLFVRKEGLVVGAAQKAWVESRVTLRIPTALINMAREREGGRKGARKREREGEQHQRAGGCAVRRVFVFYNHGAPPIPNILHLPSPLDRPSGGPASITQLAGRHSPTSAREPAIKVWARV